MTIEQQERFYSNFEFLINRYGIKRSEIEKEAGVSQGYLSRFTNRKNPNNFPSVSFLECCSRRFRVSMDDLLNTDFSSMNEPEELVHCMIVKLIQQTKQKQVQWEAITNEDLRANIGANGTGSWKGFAIDTRKFKTERSDKYEYIDYVIFKPAESLLPNATVHQSCYKTRLRDDVSLILLPLRDWYSPRTILTLWIEKRGSNGKTTVEYIAIGDDETFRPMNHVLRQLNTVVSDSALRITIDQSFLDIIDWYLDSYIDDIDSPEKKN